jgi:hypothetical protein
MITEPSREEALADMRARAGNQAVQFLAIGINARGQAIEILEGFSAPEALHDVIRQLKLAAALQNETCVRVTLDLAL